MEDYNSDELLQKYNKGLCTEYEKAVVETWFLEWEEGKSLSEEQFESINQDVWEHILENKLKTKKIKLPLRILSIAAAALAAIVFGLWFYNDVLTSSRKAPYSDVVAYKNCH